MLFTRTGELLLHVVDESRVITAMSLPSKDTLAVAYETNELYFWKLGLGGKIDPHPWSRKYAERIPKNFLKEANAIVSIT
jgi:hypothetical protein